MNTPASVASEASIRKSRRRVLWLAGFFFVPLALSFVLYYGGIWRPQGGTNKGELINPPRPLPAIAMTLADGTQSAPDILLSKWTWVYIGDGHFVSEYQMSATSDGTRITCDGVDVIAVVDGRIARKDTYLDWPAIQTQLGPELATSLTT